jgi:hypothetical protein
VTFLQNLRLLGSDRQNLSVFWLDTASNLFHLICFIWATLYIHCFGVGVAIHFVGVQMKLQIIFCSLHRVPGKKSHALIPSTSPSRCSAPSWNELPLTSLQFSIQCLPTNIGSDNHVITFDSGGGGCNNNQGGNPQASHPHHPSDFFQ